MFVCCCFCGGFIGHLKHWKVVLSLIVRCLGSSGQICLALSSLFVLKCLIGLICNPYKSKWIWPALPPVPCSLTTCSEVLRDRSVHFYLPFLFTWWNLNEDRNVEIEKMFGYRCFYVRFSHLKMSNFTSGWMRKLGPGTSQAMTSKKERRSRISPILV